MTRRWYVALAVLVLTAGLVGGLLAVVRASSVDGADRPAMSGPPEPAEPTGPVLGPTAPATPTPSMPPGGPPVGTVHVDDRYRARYHGRYLAWDDLVRTGRKLPAVSRGCRSDWRASTRDDALDWAEAGYLCLDRLTGNGFKPQGVGGSGSTAGYRIGGRPAGERNLVIISSYSSKKERGLRFPHQPGRTETTRLTVIDLDRGRYRHVELVRPAADGTFVALDSHGSGLAWAGQYLYSSSRGSLWMYNVDDVMVIDGRVLLPAVARWRVRGQGGLSSIGIDRSGRRPRLTGINYSETGTAWSQSFELDPDGRLRPGSTTAEHELRLVRAYGPGPAAVRSARSAVVPGTNFQGIGASGKYRIVNSSSLLLGGRRFGDNVVILKRDRVVARFAMPSENVESLYVDDRRRRYVTITEHGRQFLFWLPLDHLLDRAER